MPRQPTPLDLLATVRAQTPDDASLRAMFGPVADGERIQHITLSALDPNPFQRRTAGIADDDPALLELAADIGQQGVIQPLIVRTAQLTDRFQIAAGHRRAAAARLAGLVTVPCVVRALSDDAMLDVVFAENYHRTDVNAIDRAELIAMLADRGMSHQQIADRLSMSRPSVSNALRLLQLPPAIQHDVIAGTVSQRQAEAMIPLATLPKEAHDNAPRYSTTLADVLLAAKNGTNSDTIRTMTARAVRDHTKELPEHWANMVFADPEIAPFLRSPRCTDCRTTARTGDETRCADPACWKLKSGAWRGIEHRRIVEQSGGVPVIAENVDYSETAHIYSRERALLNLPEPPNPPPAPVCPNLRLQPAYNNRWDWVCHHGKGKKCTCQLAASKALTKQGSAVWKQLRAETVEALTAALMSWPIEALRMAAFVLDGAYQPQHSSRRTQTADEAAAYLVEKLVTRAEPAEPAKYPNTARECMAALLNLAGVRPPWLPPLEEEIARHLASVQDLVDTFLDPGDGLPAQQGIENAFADLSSASSAIATLDTDLDTYWTLSRHATELQIRLAALNHRWQASHDTIPEL